MGQRTAGDLIFERYLAERGVPVPEHEPDLGIGVRPEYVVELDGERCIVEVKEFAPGSWPIRRGVTEQQQQHKPIRGQVKDAAQKLKKARALKLPLVVVLTDPHRALEGLLRPVEMGAALRGDLMLQVRPSRSDAGAWVSLEHGRNGKLRNDHPYITAVVVVQERFDGTHRSDTYITHSPGAEALPGAFFAGADDDDLYDFSERRDLYILRQRPAHE